MEHRIIAGTMKKCVHTIVIDGWFPEMCDITVPLIREWAFNIGADFNLISKAKFDGSTPNYEKMQIWETGSGYDWNVYLDADMVVNPDRMPDFTMQDPRFFYYEARLYSIEESFFPHPYFHRCPDSIGVSDCFLAASSCVHDLWHPTITVEEAKALCRMDTRMMSEAAIALNIARFGLRGIGSIGPDKNHVHLQTTDDKNRPFNGGLENATKEDHLKRLVGIVRGMGRKI